MRDYSIVSAKFWIGDTGKHLRKDREAQVLAFYLITSPHAAMTGLYYCPILYMAQDTGMPPDVVSDSLGVLDHLGFCKYDEDTEVVFVVQMARIQVGEELKRKDNRWKGIMRSLQNLPKTPLLNSFLDIYADVYSIDRETLPRLLQESSEGLRRQDQDQVQEQEPEQEQEAEPDGEQERGRPARPSSSPLIETKPTEPPEDFTARQREVWEAMRTAQFKVPGAGQQTVWENVKDPVGLARDLGGPGYPAVDVGLIHRLASWSQESPRRKKKLNLFLRNRFSATQERGGSRSPNGKAEQEFTKGADLARKVREIK